MHFKLLWQLGFPHGATGACVHATPRVHVGRSWVLWDYPVVSVVGRVKGEVPGVAAVPLPLLRPTDGPTRAFVTELYQICKHHFSRVAVTSPCQSVSPHTLWLQDER